MYNGKKGASITPRRGEVIDIHTTVACSYGSTPGEEIPTRGFIQQSQAL